MYLTRIGGPEYASRANGPAASDPAEIPALDRRGEYSTGLKRRLSKPGTSDGRITRNP
jgi:hypothetical protein